jgi:hypothetical protein
VSGLDVSEEDVSELCRDFDEAVEFAALEGKSVREAFADFMEEGSTAVASANNVQWSELAELAGCGSAGIDIAATSLPVMPKQAARLLRTSDDDTSAVELEQITASDPVLAGKMLGAANSARFGFAI